MIVHWFCPHGKEHTTLPGTDEDKEAERDLRMQHVMWRRMVLDEAHQQTQDINLMVRPPLPLRFTPHYRHRFPPPPLATPPTAATASTAASPIAYQDRLAFRPICRAFLKIDKMSSLRIELRKSGILTTMQTNDSPWKSCFYYVMKILPIAASGFGSMLHSRAHLIVSCFTSPQDGTR